MRGVLVGLVAVNDSCSSLVTVDGWWFTSFTQSSVLSPQSFFSSFGGAMKNRSPLSPRRAALSLALVVLLHGSAPAVAQRAQQRFAAGAPPPPRGAEPPRPRP